ncbi:two-component regulator propeller domain-containing protein [Vibrio quintilis]|uniref:Putative diguanylate cyclase YdaM n=1 Tax=Vibrio quintilis TaxID=1117707 RepID=A0A1M7YVE7_9VIBR|nr:two-component regulator propeller domain-containing protein [Vibrio quintilis]SHO56585.1 putative diguanylate cyclase YdaM [Vibrio quintilis]
MYQKYLFRWIQTIIQNALIFIILFWGISQAGSAVESSGEIRFSQLSAADGLPSNVIYDGLQDSRGFIWISGSAGLIRYSPHEVRVFSRDIEDKTSLISNSINVLFEDTQGHLWIGTKAGLARFDRHSETFERFIHEPGQPGSLSDNHIRSIFEDHAGVLWIGSEGGLDRLIPGENRTWTVQRTRILSGLKNININAIAQDKTQHLWLGTDNGLYRWNPKIKKLRHFIHHSEQSDSLSDNHIQVLAYTSSGRLWIGTLNGGLNLYVEADESFTHLRHDENDPLSLSSNDVQDILWDEQGRLWVATTGGIDLVQGQKVTRHLLRQTGVSHSDDVAFITSVWADRHERIWFGTLGAGIYIQDPNLKRFKNYLYRHDGHGISARHIRGMAEDARGNIWFGTHSDGLFQFDPVAEKVTVYKSVAGDHNSLSSNRVAAVIEGDDGMIWIGTGGGGLNKFDPETKRFTRYVYAADESQNPAAADSLPHNFIPWLIKDKGGILWLAHFGGGLTRFDPKTETFTNYRHDPDDSHSIGFDILTSVTPLHNGQVWIGTYGKGISVFDRQTKQFRHYRHDPEDPGSLSDDTVRHIYEDSRGRIWVTTNFGLNRYYPDKDKFRVYTTKNGFPANNLLAVVEDNSGQLWISSSKSLTRFNPDTEAIRVYYREDGLGVNSFFFYAFGRTRAGQLMFGGDNGFSLFDPMRIEDNLHPPEVVLTRLEIFNQPAEIGPDRLLKQSITETRSLSLPYNQNSIGIYFSGLNYTAPDKNTYLHKLEGVDKDWVKTGSDRPFALYNHLSPGQYTFKVRAANNDGIRSNKEVSLALNILPPWWQTWWFGVLLVVLSGFLLRAIILWRVRLIAEQNRYLESQVQIRTEELEMSEARFRGLSEATFEGIFIHEQLKILEVNQYGCDLFGYDREELLGRSGRILLADETFETVRDNVRRGNECSYEAIGKRRDGSKFPIEIHAKQIPFRNDFVRVAAVRDITERKQVEAELIRLTLTDQLTGISNRKYLDTMLANEMERAKRHHIPFVIIFVDIDSFKLVNDIHGHLVGDAVLQGVSARLKQRLRVTDILGRWGGEEFMIICPDTESEAGRELAEGLRNIIGQSDYPGAGRVTASFGVTQYRPDESDDTLIQRADEALYHSKRQGRNCVTLR